MKKVFLKSMLLLCALIVGSLNVLGGIYVPVTSVDQLKTGKKLLVVNRYKTKKMDDPEWYSFGSYNSSSKVYNSTSITVAGDVDDFTTLAITDIESAHELTLGGSTGAWTLYDATDSKYLSLTNSSNALNVESSVTANNQKWTIAMGSNNLILVKNKQHTGRQIEGNQGSTRFACYTGVQSANATYLFIEATADITAAKWASLFLPVDVTVPAGTTAYYASSVSTGTITLLPVPNGIIPAKKGVLIYADITSATSYALNYSSTAASSITSSFSGVTTPTTVASLSVPAGSTLYVLGVDDSGNVGFYPFTGTLDAYKAYLITTTIAGAPSIRFEVDEEENATNIENIKANDKAVKFFENGQLLIKRDGVVYDALGRVVR